MDPNVTWKFAIKTFATTGQQKVGPIGPPGGTAQNHVAVASESEDEYARTLITIAMTPVWTMRWVTAMKNHVQQILVQKN